MQATVISTRNGVIAKIRGGKTQEIYYRSIPENVELHIGDKIEVVRQTNNPYLLLDHKLTKGEGK